MAEVEDEVDLSIFDLTQKKKKKKKKATTDATEEGESAAANGDSNTGAITSEEDSPPSYSYGVLLQRVFDFLHQNNLGLIEKTRYTMKPPQLMKGLITTTNRLNILSYFENLIFITVGTKKTLWVNYQEICKMMRRNPDHVFQYMMAELGTEGSIDGSQRLVIKGKFVPQVHLIIVNIFFPSRIHYIISIFKYIESLLKKYIKEYVICQMCKSFNTSLTRDSVSRLHFVQCQVSCYLKWVTNMLIITTSVFT